MTFVRLTLFNSVEVLINPAQVLYVQPDRSYTEVHLTNGKTLSVMEPVAAIEDLIAQAAPTAQSTPALEAHYGFIESVQLNPLRSLPALIVHVKSLDDESVVADYLVWLPEEFASNINLDPNALSGTERELYAKNIANTAKTATLQTLRAIAYKTGRTTDGAARPTNIKEYAELTNALLTGLEVVFTLDANGNVLGIFDPDEIRSPKAFRGHRKMWLQSGSFKQPQQVLQ